MRRWVCGGDAALCPITLHTTLVYGRYRTAIVIVNSHRPTRLNSTVELSGVGRCELAITRIAFWPVVM